MTSALLTFALNRQICTGASLQYNEPDLTPQCDTQESFDTLVSDYYTLFRETLRSDISFLQGIRKEPQVDTFSDTVYKLRTARQHTDNPSAESFYVEWTQPRSWQQAADSLAHDFDMTLQWLVKTSNEVRKSRKLTNRWKDRVSLEPEAVFLAVCADLNVTFDPRVRSRLLRNVKRRSERLRSGSNLRAMVEEYCVQEITSHHPRLPVPYTDILDRLGLLGHHDARSALLLAYSIREATDLKGEEFLRRVDEAWKSVNA